MLFAVAELLVFHRHVAGYWSTSKCTLDILHIVDRIKNELPQ